MAAAMRDSQRANLLIVFSLLAIVGSAAIYASIIMSWFGKASSGPARSAGRPVSPELAAARKQFREHILDAQSALALSEALYKANRPVDSFYVELWARSFYGPSPFEQAHDSVVLRRENFLGGQPFDSSSANEIRLRQLVKAEPGHADAWNYLAHIDSARADLRAALADVEQGLAAAPEDRGLLFFKAQLTVASDPSDAIGIWARVANAQPDSYEGRQAMEELRKLAGLKDEGSSEAPADAREALQELLQAKPDNPFVFSALALSAADRGDSAGARAMIAQTLSQHPKQSGALMADGALAWSQGDADLALKRFAAAFERNPDDVFSARKLAEAFDKEGINRDAALPYYVALYRREPDASDGRPIEEIVQEILNSRGVQGVAEADNQALEKHLQSDDAWTRAQACARTGGLPNPRWIDALAPLLDDDDEPVRRAAREGLLALGRRFPDALPARRDAWLADARPLVRAGALAIFAELDWSRTFPLAVKALRDPDTVVRFFAHSIILRDSRGSPEAARALAEYLAWEKDPEALSRYGVTKPAPPRDAHRHSRSS